MKKILISIFTILTSIMASCLQADHGWDEEATTMDDCLFNIQSTFSEHALMITERNSSEDIPALVNSVCYTSYQAHKHEFSQDIRAAQGRPNRGEPLSVSANKYTRKFTDTIIDDLAIVARQLQGNDREQFRELAAIKVTKSMISFCVSHKGFDYGIEKQVHNQIKLKKILG